MAEVIGIAGGVISLTGLIKQLISFYDLYNDLRDVPEDIRQMTAELAILRSTLNNSDLHCQQLESQGYNTEEFRSLLPVRKKWLEEAQKTLTDCTANAKDGRRSKLGKQIKSLLKKKKMGNQAAQLARMQATSTEARFNLNSSVNQKQHADTQASINTVHVDLKSVLLDILAKFDQTAENLVHRPSFCSNILPHQNADSQPRKQEQTESVSSPKSERRIRAPSGRPKCPQPRGKDYFALEEFAENPFHLLVACVFLNTKWEAAIPQAQKLLQQYPTAEILAKAQYHDIQPFFAHLGFFKRANWLIKLAEIWLVCPPQTDKLHTKRGRPTFRSEIAHLQGVGSFANDAWRIFCKDDLYMRAGCRIETPEWKRVAPNNERLIAYLRHRWHKEGFIWDQSTGTSQSARLLEEETVASTDTIGLETLISSISHDHRDCDFDNRNRESPQKSEEPLNIALDLAELESS